MSLYSQNLDLAKSILSFADGECVGMTPEQRVALQSSALDVLRPLANSTEPGNAEAAFLMAAHLPAADEGMSEEVTGYLVEGAARGFPDAVQSIEASGDASLKKAMGERVEELAWDGD
ncbi:hypothetical protein [Xanthomonas translucens]|uniref:hypothetical protein n=1 Tax=Xanthomonas campestris pv. translucens TaxID=343 RepID=UPI00083A7ACA|nr:hypothetical protein [Xanthomonas translucens]